MKKIIRYIAFCAVLLLLSNQNVRSQAIKTNIPFTITGNPNIGVEWSVSKQLTLNADILWSPYMFKKSEEVFRLLIGSVDFRYYVNPRYYYTNDLWDGFYIGPYFTAGNFNIGLKNKNEEETSYRRVGWGMSTGVSTGYKFYLSARFRVDLNIGVGYVHTQYDKYQLGGEFASYPIDKKKSRGYFGPTKIGASLVYNIFR